MDANAFRTDKLTNLHLVNKYSCMDIMPELDPCHHVPCGLTAFSDCAALNEYDNGVHFFIDDYRFERIWNRPEAYIDMLRKYDCVLTPDFSLYVDMPLPMQIWNVYRSRALGRYWQDNGLKVIPTLSWSTPDSYWFSFDGIPKCSVYATTAIGAIKNKHANELWRIGMDEAIKQLSPEKIIIFGDVPKDYTFECEVIRLSNKRLERVRHGRKR